jgi:hypothetical protein
MGCDYVYVVSVLPSDASLRLAEPHIKRERENGKADVMMWRWVAIRDAVSIRKS